MSYVTHGIGPLFVCRWLRPDVLDIDRLIAEVRDYRERAGEPLIYVGLTDDETELPEAAFRREVLVRLPDMLARSRAYYLVTAETGFKAGVVRAIMAGMFLAWRGAGDVRVMRSMEDVLVRERAHLPLHPEAILAQLRARGVLGGSA